MPYGLSTDRLFELKLAFLRELEASYQGARDRLDHLLKHPGDMDALIQLRDFFHKIAGTAQAVELPLLGKLAAVCERAANLVRAGGSFDGFLPIFGDGITGVAAVLESHGSISSQARDWAVNERGLTQPGIGEERVLSKILVVDDDPFSANLIDTCLRSAGFMSSYCCDPQQAWETIGSELPDLIVMDVVMPNLDGFDLCRRVRSHPAMQLTPIIFVTRRGEVEQRVEGLEAGGNDYIAKPFEPQELVARVRSHLERLATLRDMAVRDGLTRCYNHKYFKNRLAQEIARCRRYRNELSLAFLDVDHFKKINDAYGHATGDTVLSRLGGLVQASVRSTDVVARYSGDQFGLLLVETSTKEAGIITNRLLERIAASSPELFQRDSEGGEDDGDGEEGDGKDADAATRPAIPVTVSVGMTALLPDDTMESLVKRADVALREAKAAGRNQVKSAG